jgi:mevalonate kinase
MAAVGTGFSKLILFGEHAAVYGYRAIGVPLPEHTTATIHGQRAQIWDLGEIPVEDRQVLQSLIVKLETLLPDLASCGRRAIRIESSVPRGVGLGSSAALCSAVAAAALNLLGGDEPSGNLARTWQLAHELERTFHGTPSGIDTGLSLRRGVISFSPQPYGLPRGERIQCAPLWLVVGALPRTGDCAALIRDVGDRMRSGEREVQEAISELGSIANEASQNLVAGASSAFIGRLADRAMETLRSLGLSDPSLDRLLDEGKQFGALGGKLSGAGGGGAFFLICADEQTAREIGVCLEQSRGDTRFVAAPRALYIGG